MVNILLSGGGTRGDVSLVKLLAKSIPESGRLLYIPVAISLTRSTFGQCYDWITSTHGWSSLTRIDMWTDLQNRSYEDLARYSGVFIGGGNTFSLLKQVRESGFDRLLVKYITKDLPVFGGSAGAIILGRDIGTAYFGGDADKNEVGLKVLKGLDVARGYSIACHHNGLKYDHFAAEYSERTGIPTIALGDSTGIQVKNHEILVIGPSSAKVFDGEKSSIFRKGAILG